MKIILKYLVLFVIVCACVLVIQIVRNTDTQALPDKPPGAVRIATYNVHYIRAGVQEGAWSVGDWEQRKEPMQAAIQTMQADIIAFQEMESFAGRGADIGNLTLDYLLTRNPDYAAGATGDPEVFPSTQPIFYKTERFDLLDQGWFFFSDTPEKIYSRTYNGSYPAFASWVQLREKSSGGEFKVINLHTDYASRSNRLQSIELVARQVQPWIDGGETVFVVGDFNARLGSVTHGLLENLGFSFVPVQGSTYHFDRGLNLFGAIDHIAYKGTVELLGMPVVLQSKFLSEWPTDHYPVLADYILR